MNETHSPLNSGELLAIFILLLLFLLGCSAAPQVSSVSSLVIAPPVAQQPTVASKEGPVPGPFVSLMDWDLTTARPIDEAVLDSLGSLLSLVELPDPGEKQILLVEPIVDGRSGMQSTATRRIESKLADLARRKYPYVTLQPSTAPQLEKSPILLFGTLTAVNAAGYPDGKREAYRVLLVLTDLKSGRFVSK
jgi:hypothetical protein